MMTENAVSTKTYFYVFVGLMGLLILTIGATYVDLGSFNLVAALAISIAKTLLVAVFFMHLRYSSRLTWFFAIAGVFWLMFLFTLGLGDYLTRPVVPW